MTPFSPSDFPGAVITAAVPTAIAGNAHAGDIHDVIVVGGSFAGVSAALQLARARRRVLLVDAGQPRNRFVTSSHGFLGQDGRPPRDIIAMALTQLTAYPSFRFVAGEVSRARKSGDGFEIETREAVLRGRRLILATGVRDELPAIAGIHERWGQSIFSCPYCHGYEVAERRLGVIANHPMSPHQAVLVSDWGPTTYFSQGRFEPDEEHLARFSARNVAIERRPVLEMLGPAPAIEAVRLADGDVVPVDAVFTAPRTHMASTLAEQLGCRFEDGFLGPLIQVDGQKRTSVEGVFAAGDATSMMANATMASAAGVMAGVSAHQSLVFEGAMSG